MDQQETAPIVSQQNTGAGKQLDALHMNKG
jgi:hypothetical protein